MKPVLAIDGGAPVRSAAFPSWPVFDEREVTAVSNVVRSGKWGELVGTEVKAFEKEFAAYQHAKYVTPVVNGTAALEVAMRALGIGRGDEVITSSYTFIATPNAALVMGARPVLVDILPDTYLIDPAAIEAAITPRTKAIMPVHYSGCPCDMDAIMDIARRHGLYVVEDACQAWGAEWRGQSVGTIGNSGTFSFQASKNINSGEGGMVVTNDEALGELHWSLHNCGRRRGGEWYEHVRVGWNYRLTEFQGAILRVQLTRVPEMAETRERNARYLETCLSELGGIDPLVVDPRVTMHARHLLGLRYRPDAFGGRSRADFLRAVQAEGIPAGRSYLPLTKSQGIIDGLLEVGGEPPKPCPVCEYACEVEAVTLTQNLLLGTKEDCDSIVEAFAKVKAAFNN
jgi:dTDP-4-amino-4,6-dideoxygalactose transaminase